MDTIDKNYVITKSNYFITNASFDLTLEQQKLILIIASMVKPGDEDFKDYKVYTKDFMNALGVTTCSYYTEIPNLLKSLMQKVIELPNEQGLIQWLCRAIPKKGEGYTIVRFDKDLKPYMLLLKDRFTRYKLKNIINLKSKYSIRIYEMMKCNQFRNKFEIDIEELRFLLKADKIYPLYADFKRKVIDMAQREINEHTDITFTYEAIKTGRKVTALKFYISENKKNITNIDKKLDVVNEMSSDKNVNQDKINKFGDVIIEVEESKKLIAQVREIIKEKLTNADILRILQAAENDIELIKKQYKISKTTGNIKSLVGWLIRAIKDDYTEPITATKTTNNKFTNYEQREYDFDELERKARERVIKKVNEMRN